MCVKFEGRVHKSGRHWLVAVPALDIMTQGKSKKDAYFMIKDAVELHVGRKGFEVEVAPLAGNTFILRTRKSADDNYLVALLLKQQRAKYGLSTAEVALRLGITKHAYAQYEQARSLPSLTKIEAFVFAMSKHAHVIVNVFEETKAA